MMTATRPAAVAGAFYPADAHRLARDVSALLAEARAKLADEEPAPKALIAPHAGYIYSGPVAANAYARLAPMRGTDSARRPARARASRCARGLALPGTLAFETPLGSVRGRCAGAGASRRAAAGERQPRSARARAFPGSASALPAVAARRVHARPAGGGSRERRRGRAGAGAAVGRRRDADRGELGPVALPDLRPGADHGPRHGAV